MASPIGSGSAISPIHDAGTSARPSSSSGSWNRTRPRITLVSAPSAAQRVRDRATGSPARPNATTASTSHTTRHGTTTASWIRGHVPNHSSVDGVVTRVTASASPYPPSATRYGSHTIPGRRRTIPIGAGKTRARWTAAGHMSMYTPAVNAAWSANGPPWTRSLVVAPRNHGTLLPAAPHATSTSAVAAGTSGRRANTSAATAAIAIENTTMLQPSSSAPTRPAPPTSPTPRPRARRASAGRAGDRLPAGRRRRPARPRPTRPSTAHRPRRPGRRAPGPAAARRSG